MKRSNDCDDARGFGSGDDDDVGWIRSCVSRRCRERRSARSMGKATVVVGRKVAAGHKAAVGHNRAAVAVAVAHTRMSVMFRTRILRKVNWQLRKHRNIRWETSQA